MSKGKLKFPGSFRSSLPAPNCGAMQALRAWNRSLDVAAFPVHYSTKGCGYDLQENKYAPPNMELPLARRDHRSRTLYCQLRHGYLDGPDGCQWVKDHPE